MAPFSAWSEISFLTVSLSPGITVNEITVKEAAELLRVSEKTVYRWIRQGVIPAYRFQGQYRFDQDELEGWARQKRIGAAAGSPMQGDEEEAVDLQTAIQTGGIHYKIEGSTPPEVFTNAVRFFPFAPNLSPTIRASLLEDLQERETLVSTGIGHGIALPHPRHPRDWGLGNPAVGIFFLEQEVDFKALDGANVFVMFVILCSTVRGHLKMLSQVSHLVHTEEMRDFLRGEPSRTELLNRIAHVFNQKT